MASKCIMMFHIFLYIFLSYITNLKLKQNVSLLCQRHAEDDCCAFLLILILVLVFPHVFFFGMIYLAQNVTQKFSQHTGQPPPFADLY